MGLVQRDGLDRFRRALGTSRQHSTYCVTLSDAGWQAGTGTKRGSDARLMHRSELVVVWGGNPVSTQVNVMHHLARARRESDAALVVVDPYRTRTAAKADLHLMLRPGTDGALACAVDARAVRRGARRSRLPRPRTPPAPSGSRRTWPRGTPGLGGGDHRPGEPRTSCASRVSTARTRRSFLRLGYGFSRSRNGAVNDARGELPAGADRRVAGAGRRRPVRQRRRSTTSSTAR